MSIFTFFHSRNPEVPFVSAPKGSFLILIIIIYVNFMRMEEGSSAFKMLTGKPTGKGASERPMWRWEDNIRMDLKEIDINRGIGLIRLRKGIIGEPL